MKDEQKSRALQACRLIIEAYQHGEEVGVVDIDDLELAYRAASDAMKLGLSFRVRTPA